MSNRNRQNGAAVIQHEVPIIGSAPRQPTIHVDPAQFEADFKPTGDIVLLRMIQAKKTAGGIELPEGATAGEPKRAQIIAVGPGRMNDRTGDGSRLPMDPELKPGRVIYPMFQGNGMPLKIGEQTYFMVNAFQILGFSSSPPESL